MTYSLKLTRNNQSPRMGKLSTLATAVLLIQINPAQAADSQPNPTQTSTAQNSNHVISIDNTANASYNVEKDNIPLQARSNTVDVQVFSLPKYAIALTQPLTITIKPAQEVSWKNVLTNTGALDETVAVNFAPPTTLSNFKVYVDLNNNGMVDAGESELTPTVSLKAGESIHLIVTALASADFKDGDTASVNINAVVQEDSNVTAKATDGLVVIQPSINYKSPDYTQVVTQSRAGDLIYPEVGLAICNANPSAVDYVWVTVTSKKTGDIIKLKGVETGANTGRYRLSAPTELNANPINDGIIQTLNGDNLSAQATACETATGETTDIASYNIITDIDIINNQAILAITKEASVRTADVGDFVDYTVDVKNTGNTPVDNAELKDDLPQGFTYVKNSVRVDGQKYATDFTPSGKYMTLGLGTLTANSSKKVTYRVLVNGSALSGTGTNIAHATGNDAVTSLAVASPEARAHVDISAGMINTDGIIIGKVYADLNRDGIQQKERGELGVAGVRLYLEDGTFVVTDSEGKYSLYGIKAKTHVIKLDRTTLPRNVELIEQTNRNMGDPGSRFVDLRYGELHRADFAIIDGIDDEGDNGLIAVLQDRAKKVISTNNALEQAIKTELPINPITHSTTNAIEATGCKDAIVIDGQVSCNAVIYDNHATAKPNANNTVAMTVNTIAPVKELDMNKALSTADDKRIAGVTADADFLNLTNNQQVTTRKIRVQIKAPKGATTQLLLNQQPVDIALMGKEVAWEKEGIEGFDYYAVPLNAGDNILTIMSKDTTGKVVSDKSIRVHAPDRIATIDTRTPAHVQTLEADGVSEYQFVISPKDTNGQLYAGTAPVTLDSDIGTILTNDSDKNQAGIQAFIEGGEMRVSVKAPTNAGKGTLMVKAGSLTKLIPLQFTPQLRPMIAAGIVEGVLSLNNLGSGKGLESSSKNDGFEEELQSLSGKDSDKTSTHGRAAFFLKGKVRGDYLLTLAYDSDKNGKDRLFRDIQPDDYYPVYGDASAKGYDAQSTSKLYVRLDKGRSFAMYGDIKTHIDNDDGLSLGQYDRTLTGLKGHYETDKTKINAFVAQATSSQKVNETRGLGISGPYPLGANYDDVLVNSETVEVIVRDRNNPGVIVKRQTLARYSDYDIDTLSHALYLRAPIASQDLDGNPVYLRITVEAQINAFGKAGAGDEYIVGGVAGNYQLTKKINVGASYVQSDDPTNDETLASVNTVVKFNDKLKLIAEAAQYKSDKLNDSNTSADPINAGSLNNDEDGTATRVELSFKDLQKDAKLYYSHADDGFDPLSSPLTAGRTETGLTANAVLNPKTKLKAEALQTEDNTNHGKRTGASVSIERQLTQHLTGEIGVRYYDKDANAASTNYQAVPQTQTGTQTGIQNDFNQSIRPSVTNNGSQYNGTTLRGKLTADLPKVNNSKVFVEYEQDIDDANRNAWSVGGETRLWNKGRLYARHELSSSLMGDYGLDANDEHKSTVIGVDANYMKDGQVFSEYRVKDGMSARESEAAIGLRNKWKVQDGLYINTTFERLESLEGETNNTATAASIGVDYLANEKYKFTTRTEKRWGVQTDTFLNSMGYANKVNDDITLLAKNTYSLQQDNTNDHERTLDRFQIGMAYRDYDSNIIDHLAKLEYRYDDNTLSTSPYNKETYIASLHTNYHPVRRWTFSGHYAGKYNSYTAEDVTSHSTSHILAGRAMYDINERWDAGMQIGTMWTHQTNDVRYLLGAEVGYSPMANLWVSLGYNFAGYHDDDIANSDDNQQGAYLRLRFKFDEDLFKRNNSQKNPRLEPTSMSDEVTQ